MEGLLSNSLISIPERERSNMIGKIGHREMVECLRRKDNCVIFQ